MKKTNKNNNHKFLSKNYIKGAISGALALTILCSGVGVAAYSAGAEYCTGSRCSDRKYG